MDCNKIDLIFEQIRKPAPKIIFYVIKKYCERNSGGRDGLTAILREYLRGQEDSTTPRVVKGSGV